MLARPRPNDREEFFAAVERSAALHGDWVAAPADAATWAAYLRASRGRERHAFHIRNLNDDALCGVINVNDVLRGNLQQAYLGYYALVPHAGSGLMSEALTLVLGQCFGALGLHRVEANIQPGNEPSRRLAARAGLVCEGCSPRYLRVAGQWRDHERWAITREDWDGSAVRD